MRLHGPRFVSAETDESGKVFFGEMPPGEYDVYLGGWDLSGAIELEEGEGKVIALVVGQATIRGRAAPRALIPVHGPASAVGRAGEDGAFEVGSVPPGTYRVQALTDELISAPVTVVVKGSESPPPVEFTMVPSGRILLTFREPDRAVLAEAGIRLFNERGENQFLNKDPSGKLDRTTPPILPGRYEIAVTLPDQEPRRTTVEVHGGRDTKVELGAP